ncbi:protein-glutamate methylesterase/protein-glutamine glutaminase [Paludibaculum fermentans]|uniref:Protein-glutamate methylesterase/protein-glutamine glutaminase n=1 Tax=Paludibaculum fermentans TaxID=1473598 RepID=A0A7S7NN76_PALFE|nr:chemotaxis response regulator protein-glutamate methylesterase [Paludibaculum fermentans]QOY86728.1 chemotaxis response regulator protein-glutamate methylesterase [Paludibaculum fermentans]
MRKTRVLVADDSALMRQTFKRIIAASTDLELVGLARDGEDAISKARQLRPDVVSMDINMPKLDGITALQMILQEKICPVVMVSSLTQLGTATTFECLELGAFDFIAKPDGTVSSNMGLVADELLSKLRAAASRGIVNRPPRSRERRLPSRPPLHEAFAGTPQTRAVAIGISTGGPATLQEVLPQIPADVPASIFLVQHMPPSFIASFAKRLDDHCALKVVEARSGMPVEPGICYVAPGGMHLCLHRKMTGEVVIRTPTTPTTLFMPSVGVMMASILNIYGSGTIGVLMTGIGDDGADQMVAIRQAGGHTIAESEQTAVVYGMPREAVERGGACVVAPSHQVAEEILKAVRRTTE